MKKQLVSSFLAVAIVAIVLVGAGVVILSRIGARADAEQRLSEQLEDSARLVEAFPAGSRRPNADRLRSLGGLRGFNYVFVDSSGELISATDTSNTFKSLNEQQLQTFTDGQFVLFESSDRGLVIGMLAVDFPGRRGDDVVLPNAIVGTQEVNPLSGQQETWFGFSSLLVIFLSGVGAIFLANRLVKPVREIEQTTKKIASGNLDARLLPAGPAELRSLGESVNFMASDLQRSKELDRQFVVSVSHDLRTPLTVVKGYAEALADGTSSDPQQVGKTIGKHADHLERLVSDLLDLARLDANQFTFTLAEADLRPLVKKVCDGLEPVAVERSLRLSAFQGGAFQGGAHQQGEDTCIVLTDAGRLGQVISNVVENALKYAKTGVDIVLSEQKDSYKIEITDDGRGIPPEQLPRIFERFYRGQPGDSATAKKAADNRPASVGMGLAISKELAEGMGHSISIESKVEEGTCVTVLLQKA